MQPTSKSVITKGVLATALILLFFIPSSHVSAKDLAVIQTNFGEVVVSLWPDSSPEAVEQFKKLANSGAYKEADARRIVKGFLIQFAASNNHGVPAAVAASANSSLNNVLKNSLNASTSNTLKRITIRERAHDKGVLSMIPAEASSTEVPQFFICLDRHPQLDGKYAAFGQVISGLDVLEEIANIPTHFNTRAEQSKPLTRVVIESIKIQPVAVASSR